MRYGGLEYEYTEPIADALVHSAAFRKWLLLRSPFATSACSARPLAEEMKAARSQKAENWWRSHYAGKCRCNGCSGQETDILAVFEDQTSRRFAIHFEVKQPRDRFPSAKDQASNYRTRAACWVSSTPISVVPHAASATCLLYGYDQKDAYGKNVDKFDFAITYEEIRTMFHEIELPMG